MRLLVLLCALASICAAQFTFVDQNPEVHQQKTGLGHIREVRQVPPQHDLPNYRPYSQAPTQIKQLLQSQFARQPLVHIPVNNAPQQAPAHGHQGGLGGGGGGGLGGVAAGAHVQSREQALSYQPKIHFGAAPSQSIQPIQPNLPQQKTHALQAYAQAQPAQNGYAQQQQAYRQQQPNYSRNVPPEIQQLIHAQQNQQG